MRVTDYSRTKRAIDIICALTAVIVFSPLYIAIAIWLKIEKPNECALFSQERVGQYGEIFKIYKFRSLDSTAPDYLPAKYFKDYSKYSTRFGRVLRHSSIDEIPQFFNVLIGKMSIVGPRPLIINEGNIHEKRLESGIYNLRPGITGLAQINGGNLISNDEKLWWDKVYLQEHNLFLDIWICFHTVIPIGHGNLIRKRLMEHYSECFEEYKEEWKYSCCETSFNNN